MLVETMIISEAPSVDLPTLMPRAKTNAGVHQNKVWTMTYRLVVLGSLPGGVACRLQGCPDGAETPRTVRPKKKVCHRVAKGYFLSQPYQPIEAFPLSVSTF